VVGAQGEHAHVGRSGDSRGIPAVGVEAVADLSAGAHAPQAEGPVGLDGPLGRALVGALVPLGADQAGDLRFHQRLREHPNPFAQDVPTPRPSPNFHHVLGL
jgi:hypothetical protein